MAGPSRVDAAPTLNPHAIPNCLNSLASLQWEIANQGTTTGASIGAARFTALSALASIESLGQTANLIAWVNKYASGVKYDPNLAAANLESLGYSLAGVNLTMAPGLTPVLPSNAAAYYTNSSNQTDNMAVWQWVKTPASGGGGGPNAIRVNHEAQTKPDQPPCPNRNPDCTRGGGKGGAVMSQETRSLMVNGGVGAAAVGAGLLVGAGAVADAAAAAGITFLTVGTVLTAGGALVLVGLAVTAVSIYDSTQADTAP